MKHLPQEYKKVLLEIGVEYQDAERRHPCFRSAHEGYAVLLEEVDELWEAVRMRHNNPSRIPVIRAEAMQVAAMALRLILDICDGPA